jgi:hypothetical protein
MVQSRRPAHSVIEPDCFLGILPINLSVYLQKPLILGQPRYCKTDHIRTIKPSFDAELVE